MPIRQPILNAWRYQPRRASADRHCHGSFVGRRPQRDRLKTLFDEARHGASRIVFVAGEPGIGKTTVVNRFPDSLAATLPSGHHVRNRLVARVYTSR